MKICRKIAGFLKCYGTIHQKMVRNVKMVRKCENLNQGWKANHITVGPEQHDEMQLENNT